MKENFNDGTKIIKLALVNAPISKNYQDSTSIFYPPLGLLSIKSYLEINMNNIEVLLLDGMILTLTEIIQKMSLFKPDILGVSIQLLSYKNAIKICREAKRIGSITFMGGHHATQLYRPILLNKHKYVDCIIRGDGEFSIKQLCEGYSWCDIYNLVFYDKHNNKLITNKMLTCNLNELANPYLAKNVDLTKYIDNLRKSKFGYSGGNYYRTYSHKGCSFRKQGKRCVFCGRADEGYRFFSVEKYFTMLKLLNLCEDDFLFDVGDDLLGNQEWLLEAVKYKEEEGVFICPMGIFGRGDEISDKKANLLYRLGVRDVTVGVESGDNLVLNKIGKEIFGADVFYNAARILFENGIGMTPSYVLGLPGESKRSVYSTIKHAELIKNLSIDILGNQPNEMVANLLEPIPGSNAYNQLVSAFPHRYLGEDELELEQIQRDYTCLIHHFNQTEYKEYRKFLAEAGRIINTMVDFSDPQGWRAEEMKG